MDEIVKLAQAVNPNIAIVRAKRDADDLLGFVRV
jgi:hypothetical protein